MKFSIITVTRNNLGGLRRTHESLSVQICRDFEWIVIDGASGDGTVEFLKTVKSQWISEPDNGIYDAMNKGIGRAKGDYLLFLNAGDELAAPDVLEKLSASDDDFIYGDALEGGLLKPARSHKKILYGLFTHHQSMLYRRALVGSLRYDTAYKIAADYKFTLQFLKKAQTIRYEPFPLCLFAQGGLSQKQAGCGRRELFIIRNAEKTARLPLNAALYLCQLAAMALRRALPRLYWGVRKRI